MSREWKPGDVAMRISERSAKISILVADDDCHANGAAHWHTFDDEGQDWDTLAYEGIEYRPLVVIDPDDRDQVDELCKALVVAMHRAGGIASAANGVHPATVTAALRSLIEPPKPEEPTDPKALVTDRRGNTWRLLADGDWICTSGPDGGEYLAWDQLAGDRGPVSIEVTT